MSLSIRAKAGHSLFYWVRVDLGKAGNEIHRKKTQVSTSDIGTRAIGGLQRYSFRAPLPFSVDEVKCE
jgi:hypothetical protein